MLLGFCARVHFHPHQLHRVALNPEPRIPKPEPDDAALTDIMFRTVVRSVSLANERRIQFLVSVPSCASIVSYVMGGRVGMGMPCLTRSS